MVEKYYNPVINVFDRLVKWKQFHNDIDTKLRLFYLECKQNLELLAILDFDPDNEDILTTDEDFKIIVACLDTSILEMIFLEGSENNKFYEVLRKDVDIEDDEEDNNTDNKNNKKNLIQACVYLFVKIVTLKKIVKLERKGKALKKIYFRIRLNNIQDAFINIIKVLRQHKEIKEITSG